MRPWWTIVEASRFDIDDAVIIGLAGRCPALTYVTVAGYNKLTAAAIIILAGARLASVLCLLCIT